LSRKFGFQLTSKVAEAWNYIVFDGPISQLDSDMIVGLAREACFVGISYFEQLSDNANAFLPALQQPQCIAFNPQALLPKSGRRSLLASHFSGIRTVYCFNEENFMVMSAIIGSQEGERPLVKRFDPAAMPRFCDLVIVEGAPEAEFDPCLFKESVRFLSYFSLISGYVSADMSEIIIETFHPKTRKEHETVIGAKTSLSRTLESVLPQTTESTLPVSSSSSSSSSSCISEPQKVPLSDRIHVNTNPVCIEANANPIRANMKPPEPTFNYSGPSLTCVLAANLFRPSVPISAVADPITALSTAKNFKRFQKCHPLNYKPGSIPSLIGPDQLVPTTSFASGTATGPGDRKRGRDSMELDDWKPGPNSRRRILVKDAWLEEDEVRKENQRDSLQTATEKSSSLKTPGFVESAAKASGESVRTFQSSLFRNMQNNP
jgi:hypothetical protein